MINGENFFDQPIKNNKVTYENIRKLLQFKEMTIQPVVYQIANTLKIITK